MNILNTPPPPLFNPSVGELLDSVLPRKYRHFCRNEPNIFNRPKLILFPEQQKINYTEEKSLLGYFTLAMSKAFSWFITVEPPKATPLETVILEPTWDFTSEKDSTSSIDSEEETYSLAPQKSSKPVEVPKNTTLKKATAKDYYFRMAVYQAMTKAQKAQKAKTNETLVAEKDANKEESVPIKENFPGLCESPDNESDDDNCLTRVSSHRPEPRPQNEQSHFSHSLSLDDNELFGDDFFGTKEGYKPCLEPILEVSEEDSDSSSSSEEEEEEEKKEEEKKKKEEEVEVVPEFIKVIKDFQRENSLSMFYDLNRLNLLAINLKSPQTFRRLPPVARFNEEKNQKDAEEVVYVHSVDFDKEEAPKSVGACPGNSSFISLPCLRRKKAKKQKKRKPISNSSIIAPLSMAELEDDISDLLENVDFEMKYMDEEDYDIEINTMINRLCDVYQNAGPTVNEPVAREFFNINAQFHELRVEIETATRLTNALINILECHVDDDTPYMLDAEQLKNLVKKRLELQNRVKQLKKGTAVEEFVDRHSYSLVIQQQLGAIFRAFYRAHKKPLELKDEEDAKFLLRKNDYDETCTLQNMMNEEDILCSFQEYVEELERTTVYFGELLLLFMKGYEEAARIQLDK